MFFVLNNSSLIFWSNYDNYCFSFLCPTERTERMEILARCSQIFTQHHAEPFCHFRHFRGTFIIFT